MCLGLKFLSSKELIEMKQKYLSLFNRMGMGIDMNTIDYMLKDKYPDMKEDSIANLITLSDNNAPSYIFSTILSNLNKSGGKVTGL